MKKVIIIRYAEMYLKGKNRGFFERVFSTNIERALKGIRHELHRYSGRYLVEGFDGADADEIVGRLKKGKNSPNTSAVPFSRTSTYT